MNNSPFIVSSEQQFYFGSSPFPNLWNLTPGRRFVASLHSCWLTACLPIQTSSSSLFPITFHKEVRIHMRKATLWTPGAQGHRNRDRAHGYSHIFFPTLGFAVLAHRVQSSRLDPDCLAPFMAPLVSVAMVVVFPFCFAALP